jgi:7,8-dihydropterin-6-yl-methyl-4-(beta-D-ribofuranosyl)aminobenzene 5'-phosphate synthase
MISPAEVSGLKITTILDNLTQSTGPVGHWGFSVLLDYDAVGKRRRVLLDTGSDRDCFLRNLKELKIDLAGIDAIVLSHGHYDHTSATVEAVKAAGGVKVFAHPSAFSMAFVVNEREERRRVSIPEGQGLAEIKAAGGEVILSRTPIEVAPGVWATGEVPRRSFETVMELGRSRLVKVEGGSELPDPILDDQSLFLREKGVGLVVVTGCAHSGPLNILNQVEALSEERVRVMIGGTHLTGRKREYTSETIDGLRRFDLQILSPCHCTGFKAMAELARAFPTSFELNYSGKTLEPEKILCERGRGNL